MSPDQALLLLLADLRSQLAEQADVINTQAAEIERLQADEEPKGTT